MVTVRLYKNPDPYPYYSNNLTIYKTVTAKPLNKDLRSGYIDLQLTQTDMYSFNYISFVEGSRTVYAWVDNIEHLSGNLLRRVHYTIDSLRTYKSDLVLGNQYIARSPVETLQEDPLLGSASHINEYYTVDMSFSLPSIRFCVVQARPADMQPASNTAGQPSPYEFFFAQYNVNNWNASTPVATLMKELGSGARTKNIVALYSIPHVNLSKLSPAQLFVARDTGGLPIDGWYKLTSTGDPTDLTRLVTNVPIPEDITKSSHNLSIVIPEAGIIRIPDEMIELTGLCLRMDTDIFSGASNYMLCSDFGTTPSHISARGGSLSSIPILSDPYDTYISQNQNTLAVGLLGDVASLAGGIATMNPVAIGAGGMSLLSKAMSHADMKNSIPSNPPAFLGSALIGYYNKKCWLSVMRTPYNNEVEVNARYGWPYNKVAPLSIPSTGFIQTQNCSVSSNGSVPLWAINEVNQLFNAGLNFR